MNGQSLVVRFWAKVDRNGPVMRDDLGPCWVWTGKRNGSGYGMIKDHGRERRAHRVSWELHGRTVDDCLLHRCDNPRCVRPEHLLPGTQADNLLDMRAKGRARAPGAPGERNAHAKITRAQAEDIRRRYQRGEVTQVALGREFGLRQTTISGIIRGEIWH